MIAEVTSPEAHDHPIWLAELGLSRFVAIDVETTGLDSASDELIEIAAVRFQEGAVSDSFRSFVKPGRLIDPFITQLTGITDDDLRDAPSFDKVAAPFRDFLGYDPLVGHNVEFDLGFLRAAGAGLIRGRSGGNIFAFPRAKIVDTAMLGRVFWPELASFSLGSLTKTFHVQSERSHRALDDAEATGALLTRMAQDIPGRVWHSLAVDLHRLIGSTTHRSRFLFDILVRLTKGIEKPDDAEDRLSPDNGDVIPAEVPASGLLGRDGRFEQALPFFRARLQQVNLAEAVEETLRESKILLAEAPTGVGKSLAYLVPAVRWAVDSSDGSKQVIVSSYTKLLQEQLHRKDVLEIQRALGRSFRSAVLKGRSNYLCRRRLRRLLREADDRLGDGDRIQLMPLLRWAELTRTGDISEISGFSPRHSPNLWAQVSSDAIACSGSACSAAKGDFHRIAQEHAAKAQVVFVNHALLASDWTRLSAGGGRRVILDEAHHFERAVVSAATLEISAAFFRSALTRLIEERADRGLLHAVSMRLGIGAADLTEQISGLIARARALYNPVRHAFAAVADALIAQLASNQGSGKLRYRRGDRIHEAARLALEPLRDEWRCVSDAMRSLLLLAVELKGDERLPSDLLFELRSVSESVENLSDWLSRLLAQDDSDHVTWVEFGRGASSSWCSFYLAPISIGDLLRQTFWPALDSALLTSATLTVDGSFTVLQESLGLQETDRDGRVQRLMVDSPFRLSEQMEILVPLDMPDPRRQDGGHAAAVTELVTAIVNRFARGTLVLSTSNELAVRLTHALTPHLRRADRLLLSQSGGASLPDMLEQFRESQAAVFIGSASLWEGVDVVGDALQILIVTRLPFDVPTDPWVAARTERIQESGRDAFREYSLPVATLRLKQGVGRLIRHPDDRGVAVIADPRLFTTRYGEVMRRSLPVPPRSVARGEVLLLEMERFFQEVSS
ncbi:MAG: exonuclease domain-containing protein [bacterium]|nr:exonuclease domain-containing protein [bacterium]